MPSSAQNTPIPITIEKTHASPPYEIELQLAARRGEWILSHIDADYLISSISSFVGCQCVEQSVPRFLPVYGKPIT